MSAGAGSADPLGTAEAALPLGEAHRRALGSRCHELAKLLGELAERGVDSPALHELEAAVDDLREETAALAPLPPPAELRALAVEVLTLTYETRPAALAGYGPISTEAGAHLDRQADRLMRLAHQLVDDTERANAREARADPA